MKVPRRLGATLDPLTILLLFVAGIFVGGGGVGATHQEESDDEKDSEKPSLSIRASPRVTFSPARIFLVVEVKGGADDYKDFYCPTVEWDWGDGTRSQATYDCKPYEPGGSEIKRHHAVEHLFRQPGRYQVQFSLKQKDKVVGSVGIVVLVQQGQPSIS